MISINGFEPVSIPNILLAPMAGVTDTAYRIICREAGFKGLVSTEMVSAKGLCHGDAKSFEIAGVSEIERPAAIQIFGSEPDAVARAIELLSGVAADMIDINMGCPMHKVIKNGDGSALMLDPARAAAVVRAAVKASARPVSVKMRKGWDDGHVNAVDFARRLEDAGAAMITVHGRTRAQLYSGQADWRIIADVKKAVGIPVVGNGDVYCADAAAEMLSETGCDGVMIGRAARGNPWLMRDVECRVCGDAFAAPPKTVPQAAITTVSQLIAVMKRHLELSISIRGERMGVLEMRKHLAWYIKGINGAAAIRDTIFHTTDYNRLLFIIESLGDLSM